MPRSSAVGLQVTWPEAGWTCMVLGAVVSEKVSGSPSGSVAAAVVGVGPAGHGVDHGDRRDRRGLVQLAQEDEVVGELDRFGV